MSNKAELQFARSGRMVKEDGTLINEANILAPSSSSHEVLQVTTAAAKSLVSIPTDAIGAYVHTSADVRFWLDGSVPTTSVGYPKSADVEFELQSMEELVGFKVISQTENSTLSIIYRR
jgi:hypothetical protein